jgi:vancomycin permeability regulator SanA
MVGIVVVGLTAAALVRHGMAFVSGTLRPAGGAPPATLLALLVLVPWAVRTLVAGTAPLVRSWVRTAAVAVCGVVLVLGHIAAVGATDYRARADAILVLGARVYADGRPSDALKDRVRTACALWREGWAPVLVLSGGHGPDAPIDEPDAMRAIALAEGVPDAALVLDRAGRNTAASLRFTADATVQRGWDRVLVVSHDYHLARVRLLAERMGLIVRTVPARETHANRWKPAAIAREVAAFVAAWAL